MLTPSTRALNIGASPIRSLLPYANQAKLEGKKIFHLNIGQPDIKTPESALERVRNSTPQIVEYGPSEGMPELRDTVAKYYSKFDAKLSMEHVYVTTGASEAILYTLLVTCDDHDEIIVPEPFYANYLGFADLVNVKMIPLTTRLEEDFALPSPSEFEKVITTRTRAIFLCNPGNPTGQLYSAEQLDRLMSIVQKHDIFLIVDEVYREFCYDQTFTSVLSFTGMEQHIVVIDSISKVFSSCGARVGFLVTKNRSLLEAVSKYAQLRLCPPFFGQQLALACYQEADPYIDVAREQYKTRREVLYNQLFTLPGATFYKPSAAFYNVVRLPVPDSEAFCKWLLTSFEHHGNTVMLAPASGFYFNKKIGQQEVRIAYILNSQKLHSAVECLRLGLESYLATR